MLIGDCRRGGYADPGEDAGGRGASGGIAPPSKASGGARPAEKRAGLSEDERR